MDGTRWLLLVSWLLALGCSERAWVGDTPDGSARDGGRALSPNPDECGNGLDDDDDGRIDDGCPCAPGEAQSCFAGAVGERGVGICTDGVQTCAGRGSVEWGDWGDSRCEGGTTPGGEELCDGADQDCDGAIDEGCPCTAGQEQGCGLEFLVGRCMGGTQACRPDGTWSGCEGAVGPEAELCGPDGLGNGIDEDCNGVADDPCGCVPVPEVCRDGVDNDCDGTVDEPMCTPDWPPDGGIPMDAGIPSCVPSLLAPRPIAPLSTSRVTSTRPRLSWELPPGASGAVVELCSDPECTAVLETLTGMTSVRPISPVSSGATFWRVRTMSPTGASCATSPTWEFFSGVRDAGLDTTQGFNADFNRDGHPDFIMGTHWIWADPPDVVFAFTPTEFEAVYGREGALPDDASNQLLPIGPGMGKLAWTNIGDIDGDGFGDVASSDGMRAPRPRNCQIHRGTATGISEEVAAVVVDCMYISGLGDFDGDGYGDLAVRTWWGPDVPLLRLIFGSSSLSSLVEVDLPASDRNASAPNIWQRHAGDLNGDGLGDVFLVDRHNLGPGTDNPVLRLAVYYGNASRVWGAGTSLGDTFPRDPWSAPRGHAAADVNGDGYGDLISAHANDPGLIFYGGPAGIATTASATVGLLPVPIRGMETTNLGDVNSDGFEDVVVLGILYLGSAAGLQTTTPAWSWSEEGVTWIEGVGDFDGDGYEDAIVEDEIGLVSVLRGTPTGLGAGTSISSMATRPPGAAGRRARAALCGFADD